MKKITVLDFCNQIGAASDEIPVVVKAGPLTIGHFASLYIAGRKISSPLNKKICEGG